LGEYLSRRKSSAWILRIATGSLAYFPIYFFFGMLITPFVLPYYNNSSFGLRIPSFAVLIPVELFRGFVYTLTVLPLLATLAGGRTTRFAALASMLYIPGGLIPLLGNATLPAPIIPFHGVEILADSIVYGLLLSRILSPPKSVSHPGVPRSRRQLPSIDAWALKKPRNLNPRSNFRRPHQYLVSTSARVGRLLG